MASLTLCPILSPLLPKILFPLDEAGFDPVREDFFEIGLVELDLTLEDFLGSDVLTLEDFLEDSLTEAGLALEDSLTEAGLALEDSLTEAGLALEDSLTEAGLALEAGFEDFLGLSTFPPEILFFPPFISSKHPDTNWNFTVSPPLSG